MMVRGYTILVLLLVCVLVQGVSAAENWTRPAAVSTVPTIAPEYAEFLTVDMWGGNETNTTNDTNIYLPDVEGAVNVTGNVYADTIGDFWIAIPFTAVFFMIYIMSQNITLPLIVGMITSGYILYRLPEPIQYLVSAVVIPLGVVYVVYFLMKDRN